MTRPRTLQGEPLTPGKNVDKINPEKGLNLLKQFGYDNPNTTMLIEYCLARWARGEEQAAEKAAIDSSFYGIDYTSWRAVLAASMEK